MTRLATERTPEELAAQSCEVVIAGPDADWLAAFTRRLVEDRLAAWGTTSR